MSFKLPTYPSPRADVHELADYAEFVAHIRGTCSARDVESHLGRLDDNAYNVGIDDSDLENERLSEGMMLELSRRLQACGGGYAFSLSDSGTLIEKRFDEDEPRNWVYVFLLFSTRLNMAKENMKAEIDGTKLLEQLSAFVLCRYLGADRARTMVFGTSAKGSFPEKINALCCEIKEGGHFRPIDTGSVDANDDKLDVVGWIPFSDLKPSKLSIFGQCKTGTTWENKKTELQPVDFVKKWMSYPFIFDPVRAFFISESADRAHFSDGVEAELMVDIRTWTSAAIDDLKASSWLSD